MRKLQELSESIFFRNLKWIKSFQQYGEHLFNKKKSHILLCPASNIRESSRGNWDGITTGYNQTGFEENVPHLFKKLTSITKPTLQLTFADTWKSEDDGTTGNRHLGRYRLVGNKHIAFRHSKEVRLRIWMDTLRWKISVGSVWTVYTIIPWIAVQHPRSITVIRVLMPRWCPLSTLHHLIFKEKTTWIWKNLFS